MDQRSRLHGFLHDTATTAEVLSLEFLTRYSYVVGIYGTIVDCLSSVCHGYIVVKRCEIETRLLLITNRNSGGFKPGPGAQPPVLLQAPQFRSHP